MDPLITVHFLLSINQRKDAKTVLDIIQKYATTLQQIDVVAKLYSDLKCYRECLDLAYRAQQLVTTVEEKNTVRKNIIASLLNTNKPVDALTYIEEIEKENKNDHDNLLNKAFAFYLLNRKKEGEQTLRSILEEPHTEEIDNKVRFNLGSYDLYNGEFKKGNRTVLLDEKKINTRLQFSFPKHNYWSGEVIPGKTILICAEAGIGDEIINVRFCNNLKQLGMNPIWYTDRKDLAAVFNRCGFTTITDKNQYNPNWLWCYSMPISVYLDLDEHQLWNGPYLFAQNKKESLVGKFKIGIKCSGNPEYEQNLHRTVPFNDLIDCIPTTSTIYSFHIDNDSEEHHRVHSLKDKINTWDDTLDYINQMDLVISSCTSVLHAASAMDKKTIAMIPILNYHIWAKPGNYSDWYSKNTRIIRQTQCDNWDSAFKELKQHLHNEVYK